MELSAAQIGKIIKYYRTQAGITQFQLAEDVEIDYKQISKIERGVHYPSLPTFLKLIRKLQINIDEFYIIKDYKIEENKLLQLAKTLSPKQSDLAYKILKDISNY